MRVVHVTSSLDREGAGVREAVLGLSRAQQDLGIDVIVLGLADGDWTETNGDWQGVQATAFSVLGPRSLGYAPYMGKGIVERAPDLVHLHGLWMYPGRSVLEWHERSRGKYIVSPHGMLAPAALSYSRIKKGIASLWYQNKVFEYATAYHATSSKEADEIRDYGLNRPIEIFANGIDDVPLPERRRNERKTVLSLGRVTRHKALDQLIEAWALLESEFPDWELVIVGPDEKGECSRLRSLVDERALRRVSFHGATYGRDKYKLMRSADIFVLPSKSENFGITVAESLLLEVPVIVSKGAPWSGLEHERCGRWVDFGAKSLFYALREMMDLDEGTRYEMGARGRIWMKRDFTWQAIAKQSRDAYERIASTSS